MSDDFATVTEALGELSTYGDHADKHPMDQPAYLALARIEARLTEAERAKDTRIYLSKQRMLQLTVVQRERELEELREKYERHVWSPMSDDFAIVRDDGFMDAESIAALARIEARVAEAERQRDIAIHNAETVARNATTSGEAQRRRIAHLEGALRRIFNMPTGSFDEPYREVARTALTPQEDSDE